MNYFLDQEFIEGFRKRGFLGLGGKQHFIELISIAIVADDGREYFAISSEYDFEEANDWVKENVIKPLYIQTVPGEQRAIYHIHDFHRFFGKEKKVIASEIYKFVNPHFEDFTQLRIGTDLFTKLHNAKYEPPIGLIAQPTFYGYFADYDWVLFCSLFGRMIELPAGFPMYCRDVKQMLDEAVERANPITQEVGLDSILKLVKQTKDYPVNDSEHDALADARWIKKLHKFVKAYGTTNS
jgi:hypothetical protein